jgi:hypothetical protein
VNPLGWRREHLAALVAFAISGGLGGLMLGVLVAFLQDLSEIHIRRVGGHAACIHGLACSTCTLLALADGGRAHCRSSVLRNTTR